MMLWFSTERALYSQMRTRYSRSTEPLGTAKGVGVRHVGGSSCVVLHVWVVNFQQVIPMRPEGLALLSARCMAR